MRYFDRVYDPTVYTPNSIDGLKMYPYAFLRNMPFLRKAALYPMRNIFGDPIQTPDRGSEQGIGERATRLMFDRFLNNMVEDAEHELEVAASKLELIIERNKKHEEVLRMRHRQMIASEESALNAPTMIQTPLPA